MNNNRLMDVNPQKKFPMNDMSPASEAEKSPEVRSRFRRMKEFCASCYPRTAYSWFVALLASILLWQLLVSFSLLPSLTFPLVDSGKWQAVFLTNGQVYFGHLREVNGDYVRLSDIYYLRVSQQLLPAATSTQNSQQQMSLVKLGDELYGPEDAMNIPKGQIIHWENMKEASPVVQAINAAMLQAKTSVSSSAK